MNLLKRITLGLAASLVVMSAANAEEITPALREVVEKANAEGALTLVWGNHILGGAAGAEEAEKLINAKYGTNIKITFTTGPSGPTIRSQLLQEHAAGQPATTDIFAFADADGQAIWEAVDWPTLVPTVPAEAVYLDGKGVAYASPIIGITYNSNLISEADAPKSLEDLLKPEWKGKVATMPYIFGTQFFALPALLGEEKAMDFQKAFAEQAGGLIRCGEEDRIVSGEFLILAVDCGQYAVAKRKAEGQPLGWAIPSEGVVMRSWLAGIPVHAAHPNAAKLFVAFILSPDGQEFVNRVQGMNSAMIPGTETYNMVKSMQDSGTTVVDGNKFETDPDMIRIQNEMAELLQQ